MKNMLDTSTWIDPALDWEYVEPCMAPDCEQEATHMLRHVPCGLGLPLCIEHAVMMRARIKLFEALVISAQIIVRGKCPQCMRRAHRGEFEVVPIPKGLR